MAAAAAEENGHEAEKHVEDAVPFCSEHAVYGVVGEEAFDGLGAIEREEIDVEAVSRDLLLNGGGDGAEVLEKRKADEEKRAMRIGRAGSGDERF